MLCDTPKKCVFVCSCMCVRVRVCVVCLAVARWRKQTVKDYQKPAWHRLPCISLSYNVSHFAFHEFVWSCIFALIAFGERVQLAKIPEKYSIQWNIKRSRVVYWAVCSWTLSFGSIESSYFCDNNYFLCDCFRWDGRDTASSCGRVSVEKFEVKMCFWVVQASETSTWTCHLSWKVWRARITGQSHQLMCHKPHSRWNQPPATETWKRWYKWWCSSKNIQVILGKIAFESWKILEKSYQIECTSQGFRFT